MVVVDTERLLKIFSEPAYNWSPGDKDYIEILVKDGKRDFLKSMRSTVYTKE